MTGSVVNATVGLGIGYEYAECRNKEIEIKQGENYYLSTFWQCPQAMLLGTLIGKIVAYYPKSSFNIPVQLLTNIVPIVQFPFGIFTASVKHEHYEAIAPLLNAAWDQSRFALIPIRFPTNLGNKTVKILNFLAENTGKMINIAMIVCSVAFIIVGNKLFGACVLASLTYSALDVAGYVPRKISLFMETYMPAVSLVGSFIGGSFVLKIFSLLTLPNYISSSSQRFIHEQIDSLSANYFFKNSVTLKEVNKTVVVNKDLSFEQINEILDGDDHDYRINPAHCSKAIERLSDYPINKNFDLYLTLFDKINWVEKYPLIRNRLLDDEIFIASLKKNYFQDVKLEVLKENFDHYMTLVAKQNETTVNQFAADWLRKQMAITVEVLKGDRRVKGFQKDLEDTIYNFSKILPHLESLDRDGEKVELEDSLLKIATEGGDYCARGLKRVSNELVNYILAESSKTHNIDPDPLKDYETKVERTLLELRNTIIQASYKRLMLEKHISDAIADDVHGFDDYRIVFSLGFGPLTEYERKSIEITQLGMWIYYKEVRDGMYAKYRGRLDKAIEENGEVNFGNYIRQVIENNTKLTKEQKELIIEKYTERNEDLWTAKETDESFHRLMFVMLGILQKNTRKN